MMNGAIGLAQCRRAPTQAYSPLGPGTASNV